MHSYLTENRHVLLQVVWVSKHCLVSEKRSSKQKLLEIKAIFNMIICIYCVWAISIKGLQIQVLMRINK